MLNKHHKEILDQIKARSGKPTQHTFLDGYLGNCHPRYSINAPAMRQIAREWMRSHRDMSSDEFAELVTSLVNGVSSTEKCMAGVMLDVSTAKQRTFPPSLFDKWIDQLTGWAEVDSVCTGAYTVTEIPGQWKAWKKLLARFAKSRNINKRRASLVLFCSPLRAARNDELAAAALANVSLLKHEKPILITKAISWVLRSAVPRHPTIIKKYLALNKASLPRIAVRETLTVIRTGKKTKSKPKA